MFCPNCGNDCGNAKFCPECGQRLPQKSEKEQKSSVWSVGMPCPHCGGTRLDGGCCAFCGAQLVLNEEIDPNAEDDSFVLPEIVVGFCRILNLNENSFTYRKNAAFSKKYHEYEVPYAQIESVTYFRNNMHRNGLNIVDHAGSKRTTEIRRPDDGLAYQLFCYLKTVAPSSTEFIIEEKYLSDDISEKWIKRFDTDAFFNAYNPYQKRAGKRIEELTGLYGRAAASIVAKVFSKRQEALYSEKPDMAIRDLNRVIREYKCELEEERRKQQERDAMYRKQYETDY